MLPYRVTLSFSMSNREGRVYQSRFMFMYNV